MLITMINIKQVKKLITDTLHTERLRTILISIISKRTHCMYHNITDITAFILFFTMNHHT